MSQAEHPNNYEQPQISARKIFNFIKTPITLLVLLALVAFGGWWGYAILTQKPSVAPAVPCQVQEIGKTLTSSRVVVRVYNGGSRRGLAGKVGDSLEKAGFIVDDIDNTEDRINTTVIKGSSVDDPEFQLVAGFFPDAELVADGRIDHIIEVYVGNKFTQIKENAPKEVAVPSGQACLPVLETSSPTPTETPAS